MDIKYAWFSQKQFNNNKNTLYSKIESEAEFDSTFPWIYYEIEDGRIYQISEITNDSKYKSNFDDVKYIGKVKKFHGAYKSEQNFINNDKIQSIYLFEKKLI